MAASNKNKNKNTITDAAHYELTKYELLAKSSFLKLPDKDDEDGVRVPEYSLHAHTRDVLSVAETFFTHGLADRALTQLGLEPDLWRPRAQRALCLAAVLHDLGKANHRFQAMLRRHVTFSSQPLRHEALSAYIALSPDLLRDQLFPTGQLTDHPAEVCAVLAVLGHHVKYCVRGPSLLPGISDPGATGSIRLLLGHPSFTNVLALGNLALTSPSITKEPDDLLNELDALVEELTLSLLELPDTPYDGQDPMSALDSEWGRLLAMIKAWLVSCDVIASALVQTHQTPAQWATDAFDEVVTASALNEVIGKKLGDHLPRPFQQEMASTSRPLRRVVIAGCGSGKTLGAYMWAKHYADGKKLSFCYPTTGTATEGFADYVMDINLINSRLIHGRSNVDLNSLRSNHPGWSDHEEELLPAIRGLETISSAVNVCTVDSVLGLVQNHRRGLTASTAIAASAFVFDEIHAYDASLWSALITFLKLFPQAPVLMMSASLPPSREQELLGVLGQTRDDLVFGPSDLELIERYTLATTPKADALVTRAVEAASAGQRVLFVANTVARAMKYREQIIAKLPQGASCITYHSRFRYEDRVARHRETVTAFKSSGSSPTRGVVAITTQVAEMSLDLDADVLITEVAPIPSLIQRMGRLNRQATAASSPRDALILTGLTGRDALPYEEEHLLLAEAWIKQLGDAPLSQRALADAFVALSEERDAITVQQEATLIAQPVHASRGKLRDAGMTADFISAPDAASIRTLSKGETQRAAAIEATIPMPLPRWWSFHTWDKIGMAYIVPQVSMLHYDPLVGAKWDDPRRKAADEEAT